jgi:hypothetical protein
MWLWHDVVMPKANLRILESSSGPFHSGKCSVCGEKFEVLPNEKDFKRDMLDQFDAHLQRKHPRQWEFKLKKALTRGRIR